MPKFSYKPTRFHANTTKQITTVNAIIQEYQSKGYQLTLRQLYYQLVSRDIIPNRQSEYKKLGEMLNNARLAGLVDWDSIIDRTRNLVSTPSWRTPESIIGSAAYSYKIDLWKNQPRHVEVWIEKDALVGVIENVCGQYRVPYFSCRGYTSQSEMWSAAMRLSLHSNPVILHLGDHDPSGVHMTMDIEDRMQMFRARQVEVRRLALNMDQIEEYNPPPNPAKESDSRFASYADQHGDESWELDALDPDVISNVIEQEILSLRDPYIWQEDLNREANEKNVLKLISEHYDKVAGLVKQIDYGYVDAVDLPDEGEVDNRYEQDQQSE